MLLALDFSVHIAVSVAYCDQDANQVPRPMQGLEHGAWKRDGAVPPGPCKCILKAPDPAALSRKPRIRPGELTDIKIEQSILPLLDYFDALPGTSPTLLIPHRHASIYADAEPIGSHPPLSPRMYCFHCPRFLVFRNSTQVVNSIH